MHAAPRIFLLVLALTGWVAADLPKKAPITKYVRLWTDSPFTSKPPPPEAGPVYNPLEDYSLAGISPVTGGYRVTLLNKKNPEERIIVETDRPSQGFKILSVARKAGDPLGTVVRMMSGSVAGTVAFDEKLLTLSPPPAAVPQAPPGTIPGQPPGVAPNQINIQFSGKGTQGQVQPRPRVIVPPPAVQQGKSSKGGSSNSSHSRPDYRSGR